MPANRAKQTPNTRMLFGLIVHTLFLQIFQSLLIYEERREFSITFISINRTYLPNTHFAYIFQCYICHFDWNAREKKNKNVQFAIDFIVFAYFFAAAAAAASAEHNPVISRMHSMKR